MGAGAKSWVGQVRVQKRGEARRHSLSPQFESGRNTAAGEFCEKEEEAGRSKVRYEKEKGEEEKCGNLCPRPTPLPPPAWTPKSRCPSEGQRSFKDGLRRRRKRTT